MSSDEQICDVLAFMARHLGDRPLTFAEIEGTRHRWSRLTPEEKATRWERCRRRFAAAQPVLAQKGRVRHASELVLALKGGERNEALVSA